MSNCSRIHFGFAIGSAIASLLFLSARFYAQEQGALVGDRVLVVTPAFSRISPGDRERKFDLNFFFPKNVPRPDGVITYNCPIVAATYSITTPTGGRYLLALTERNNTSSNSERVFWLSSRWEQCLDAIGECTGTGQRRSGLVWKRSPPSLKEAGEYRLVISGTFHDKLGVGPNFAFRSNEAVWLVDPSVVPLDILKAKAQKILEKDIPHGALPIVWRVSDTPSGDRLVGGRLRSSDVPEDLAREAKKNTPAGLVGFGGLDYAFLFSPEGQLLSKEHKTHWISE